MNNNFERILEGVLSDIGDSIKHKVVDNTIGKITTDGKIAAQKRRKDAADKKIKAHQLKKDADEAVKKAKNLKETRVPHKELQSLGMAAAAEKKDGSGVNRFGKNYLMGLYNKRLDDAKNRGDKFEVSLMKKALKSLKVGKKLSKKPTTLLKTPEGS